MYLLNLAQFFQHFLRRHGPAAHPNAAGIVDRDTDGRRRAVAGDLRNGFGAVGAELIVHIDEDRFESYKRAKLDGFAENK